VTAYIVPGIASLNVPLCSV